MKTIFFILLFCHFVAGAQDTTTNAFIKIPPGFVQKYGGGKLKVGVNQFHAVQTTAGEWVTSANAVNEFPQLREVSPSGIFTIIRLRRDEIISVSAGTPTPTVKPPRPVQRPRVKTRVKKSFP